jgi:hypothetical protein
MKKSILKLSVILLSSLLSLNSSAQPPAGEGPMGPPPEFSKTPESSEEKTICQLQTDRLNKKLKLGKEQLPVVEKITATYVNKRLALKKKEGNKEDLAARRLQIEQERDQSLKKILTEKQFTRYLKQKQVLENSFENIGSGGIPPPPGM